MAQVVDVIGRDERDTGPLGEAHHALVDAILEFDPVALELQPEMLDAEHVAEVHRELFSLHLLVLPEELVDLSREAAREAVDTFGVLGEELLVDPRPEVEPSV